MLVSSHTTRRICVNRLHLTINFDGIKQADGTRLHAGIHEKVDSSIELLELNPMELAKAQQIEAVGDLMPAIIEQIKGRAQSGGQRLRTRRRLAKSEKSDTCSG